MEHNAITPILLIEAGYREVIFEGRFYYVKNRLAITFDGFCWRPCNIDFGRPYATNVYVNTMEELEQLMKEGM